MHMDEFIDLLLRESMVCDVQLPRLQVSLSSFAVTLSEIHDEFLSRSYDLH